MNNKKIICMNVIIFIMMQSISHAKDNPKPKPKPADMDNSSSPVKSKAEPKKNKLIDIYSIQVFAGTSREKSFRSRRFFSEKGYETFIYTSVYSDSIILYKVSFGIYFDKKMADKMKKKISNAKEYKDYHNAFVIPFNPAK